MGLFDKTTETGRSYDPEIEIAAVLTGQRIQDLDVAQSLQYRVYEFSRRKRLANKILSSVLKRRGTVSDAEIIDAYERSEANRKELYGEMSETVQAARNLGINERDIQEALKAASVSERDRALVKKGIYFSRIVPMKDLPAERRRALLEAQRQFGQFPE